MGPALCLFSAACFGAMPIFGKLAYAEGVTPGELLLIRFAFAAVLLGAVVRVQSWSTSRAGGLRGGSAGAGPVGPRQRPTTGLVLTALGLGAVGYAAQAGFFFAALERMDAPLVSLVLYTYPALVTVAAALLGRTRLTHRRVAALLVSSVGTLMVLLGAGGVSFDLLGAGLAFGAAATYTTYILVSDTAVHRLPPTQLAALVMIGAFATLAVFVAVRGGPALDFGPAGWLWIGCIAVVSTVLAMLSFFGGLRRTGPSSAAILSTFEPAVTTVLAVAVLDEFLTPVQLAGGVVVLSSVVILQQRAAATRMEQEGLAADSALPSSVSAAQSRVAERLPTG